MHIFFVLKKTNNMTKFVSTFILIAIQIILLFAPIFFKILLKYDKNKSTLTLKMFFLTLIKFLELKIFFDKQKIQIEGIVNTKKSFSDLTFKKFKPTWLIKATKLLKANVIYDFNVYDIMAKNSAIVSNFALIAIMESLKKIYFKKSKGKFLLNYSNSVIRGKFFIFTTIFFVLYELLKSISTKIGVKNATKRLYTKPN